MTKTLLAVSLMFSFVAFAGMAAPKEKIAVMRGTAVETTTVSTAQPEPTETSKAPSTAEPKKAAGRKTAPSK